ncbi:hypothetical protein FACS189485_18990 [Spirochaetia bacterium]|nr:hypothetical protein FACS189485_18990 [Spirochaetia bacterium]
MLNWVAKVFRGFFEFILWVLLIFSTIAGGFYGKNMGGYNWGGPLVIGAILGFLAGLILVVLGGGFIANFLSLVKNVEILIKLNGGTPEENEDIEKPIDNIENSVQNIWRCPKCNAGNPTNTTTCKTCGYKLG